MGKKIQLLGTYVTSRGDKTIIELEGDILIIGDEGNKYYLIPVQDIKSKEKQPKYAYCESCIGGENCNKCFMPLVVEDQGGLPGYYHRREEQPKEMPEVPTKALENGVTLEFQTFNKVSALIDSVKDLQDRMLKLEKQ